MLSKPMLVTQGIEVIKAYTHCLTILLLFLSTILCLCVCMCVLMPGSSSFVSIYSIISSCQLVSARLYDIL